MLDIIKKYLSKGFIYAVASSPLKSTDEEALNKYALKDCSKVKIKPVLLKGKPVYQVTRTVGTKELHENLEREEAAELLAGIAGHPYKNVEVVNGNDKLSLLANKKGEVTVKEHKGTKGNPEVRSSAAKADNASGGIDWVTPAMAHNRQKQYLMPEGTPLPFLVELGVMTPAGKVIASKYDKFKQINRYLEFIDDIVPALPKGRTVNIVDFGCGKSYLTFAMYYLLVSVKGLDVQITGLDLKKDVIANCNALAKKCGYDRLNFLHGDIARYESEDGKHPDMVVTLHACDTATDYALEKAVKWGASVIMCVPCCQHELNKQIECDILSPVMKYGLLKERFAALLTDGLRAEMLEESGYKTQILEFIDMEHTPKNILIRAVKRKTGNSVKTDFEKTAEFMHAEPTLQKLLFDKEKK
ncbi:MAG: SAM-dependent methyltransferase [Lachnospiraceae bacterium]|nr:SAM-dependent methyltransferase [Lachnospiraceae bacterium]